MTAPLQKLLLIVRFKNINFLLARKMFNTKYNQIIQENFEKENRIRNIQNTLNTLKIDIEARQNNSQVLFSNLIILANY